MSLISPKTTIESDLADKDASVMRCAEAAHHLVAVMRNETPGSGRCLLTVCYAGSFI